MADIVDDKQASGTQRIVGRDESFAADVFQGDDGVNRLQVEAQTSPLPLGKGFAKNVLHNGSPSLNVDGSSTPVEFTFSPTTEDMLVSRLSFYGRDNGVEYGRFLALYWPLNNGLVVEIQSEGVVYQFKSIKTTDDFRNKFSIIPSDFVLDKISGDDAFTAAFNPRAPFYLRQALGDYVKVTVQDDLHRVNYLEFLVVGAVQ